MPKRKLKDSFSAETAAKLSPRGPKSKQVAGDNRRPTLLLMGYVDQHESIHSTSMEFHMTIRTKITDLRPKQASMLLAVAVVRSLSEGVDFSLYLALEFLSNYLTKSGYDPLFIKDERVRQTVLLAELVLIYVRGKWFDFLDREEIPLDVKKAIVFTGWLPNERTVRSWSQHWDLEKYLMIQIVPVDTFRRRNNTSSAERYSSYTRGYGQDGNPPAPGKTKSSPELDGDATETTPPSFTLQEYEKYLHVINFIEIAKAKRVQDK
jgi:hypothetical protein